MFACGIVPLLALLGCGSTEGSEKARGTSPGASDIAAFRDCVYARDPTGFMNRHPGIVDIVVGEVTEGGDPRADLPVVVAFSDDRDEARALLERGVSEARAAFPVGDITVSGEDGTVLWAAVGPALIYEENIGPDDDPDDVRSRLNDNAAELVNSCLEVATD